MNTMRGSSELRVVMIGAGIGGVAVALALPYYLPIFVAIRHPFLQSTPFADLYNKLGWLHAWEVKGRHLLSMLVHGN